MVVGRGSARPLTVHVHVRIPPYSLLLRLVLHHLLTLHLSDLLWSSAEHRMSAKKTEQIHSYEMDLLGGHGVCFADKLTLEFHYDSYFAWRPFASGSLDSCHPENASFAENCGPSRRWAS